MSEAAKSVDIAPLDEIQEWIDKCGIRPVWGRVAVRPLSIEDTDDQFKGSMIAIPETVKETHQRAQQHAILVAVDDDSFADWKGLKPKIGDTVLIDKYVGFHFKTNGELYRMMNDDQIVGIVESRHA